MTKIVKENDILHIFRTAKLKEVNGGNTDLIASELEAVESGFLDKIDRFFQSNLEGYSGELDSGDWTQMDIMSGTYRDVFARMVNTGKPCLDEYEHISSWLSYVKYLNPVRVQPFLPTKWKTGADVLLKFLNEPNNDGIIYYGDEFEKILRKSNSNIASELFDIRKVEAYFTNKGFFLFTDSEANEYLVRILDEAKAPICETEIEVSDL